MLIASLIVIFGVFANYLIVNGYLHSDVLFFLYEMQNLLQGKILYEGIIDVNSPFIFYMNIPAIFFSRITNISLEESLLIVTYLPIGILTLLVFYFLRKALQGVGDRLYLYYVFGFYCFTVFFSSTLHLQRDYLISLVLWPYALARYNLTFKNIRAPKALLFLVGFFLVVGVFLKPIYLSAIFLLEVFLLYKHVTDGKRVISFLSWEHFGAIISGVLILLYLALYLPAYFAFFPLFKVYLYYYHVVKYRIFFEFSLAVLAPLLWGIFIKRYVLERSLYLYLTFLAVISLVPAFLQRKAFYTHFQPSLAFAFVATSILLYIVVRDCIKNNRFNFFLSYASFSTMLLVGFIAFFVPFMQQNSEYHFSGQYYSSVVSLLTQPTEEVSYMAFTTHMYPFAFVFHHADAVNLLPYLNLWFLPGFYYGSGNFNQYPFNYNSFEEMSTLEQREFKRVTQIFVESPPTFLFVDVAPGESTVGVTFDYLEYYSQDASFAEMLKNYEYAGGLEDSLQDLVFDIYKLKSR